MIILRSLILLAMIAAPLRAVAGDYATLAAGVLAMHTQPKPPPVVPVAPVGGVCPDCRGKGKLGDGTVMITCPTCNGTGRAAVGTAEPAAWPTYPPHGTRWSHPGSVRSHILSGEHRGLFDPEWVATQSNASLEALHGDHHDRRVRWEYVVQPGGVVQSTQVSAARRSSSNCPGGICPQDGGGFFQRLINR